MNERVMMSMPTLTRFVATEDDTVGADSGPPRPEYALFGAVK
jgi:hypothetical protein